MTSLAEAGEELPAHGLVRGFKNSSQRIEWRSSAYLGLKALVRLKPASVYVQSCSDSLHVGGKLSECAWSLNEQYDKLLKYADAVEQETLKKKLAFLKLKVVILGGDTKANHSGLRVYFAEELASGKFVVTMCLIDLRLLSKVDHKVIYGQIEDIFAKLGFPISGIGAWVADGASVNGVRPEQTEDASNVWSKLRQGGSPRLQWVIRKFPKTIFFHEAHPSPTIPGYKNGYPQSGNTECCGLSPWPVNVFLPGVFFHRLVSAATGFPKNKVLHISVYL